MLRYRGLFLVFVLPVLGCGGSGTSVENDGAVDAAIDGYVPVDNDGDQFPSDVDCDGLPCASGTCIGFECQ